MADKPNSDTGNQPNKKVLFPTMRRWYSAFVNFWDFFWRPVATGNANQLAFEKGGEKFLLMMGLLQLSAWAYTSWFVFLSVPMAFDEISAYFQVRNYRAAIMTYFAVSFFSSCLFNFSFRAFGLYLAVNR